MLVIMLLLTALTAFSDTCALAAHTYTPVDELGLAGAKRGQNRQPAAEAAAPGPEKSAQPAQQAPRQEDGKVRLFGTVEFKRPLSSLPGWLDVLERNKNASIFQPQKYLNKKTTWESLKQRASGLSPREQLRLVNTFWNTWPYREDMDNWGKQDYWEIPAEFLSKSGDCEDYAIAKYFTLKELGFDPHDMRIVVLRDTVRNLAHAVLAVYLDGDALVLDNLSNMTLSHKRLGNYLPQYSVNEFGRWAHIRGKKGSK